MASEIENMLPAPPAGFRRVHEEYLKLIESDTNESSEFPYIGGASLTPSDFLAMKIGLDPIASSAFWKPCENTRCTMQGALDSALGKYSDDFEGFLSDSLTYKTELVESPCPTIADASGASTEYCGVLEYLLNEGALHTEAFVDASGDRQFQNLGCVLVSISP